MASLLNPGVYWYRNDTFRPALAALVEALMRRNYSSHMIGRIFDFSAVHGTLAGAPGLDPADEADCECAFVDALPAVPMDSDAWDRDTSVIFDAEWLSQGNHPWPVPAIGDDDRAFDAAMEAYDATMPLPAIPDDRDPGDWAEYRRMFDRIDRDRECHFGYE
jgi:hypothetical protein